MVDKQSQRAAWLISGKTRPIMETGIFNLTKDTAPALVHFADGQTQQWLLVRLGRAEGVTAEMIWTTASWISCVFVGPDLLSGPTKLIRSSACRKIVPSGTLCDERKPEVPTN